MISKKNLIIPIHVDALCVGKEDNAQRTSSFMAKTATFTSLPYKGGEIDKPNICDGSIMRSSFATTSRQFGQGVHLHWALPEALTRATENQEPNKKDDISMQFPVVPDRWLVTRVITGNTNSKPSETTIKSWVVESDHLSIDEETHHATDYIRKITVPMFEDSDKETNPQPFRYMGRAIPLEDWKEDPTAERFPELTAVGYGDSGFAAYYPNCRSVFGFHDNFNELDDFNPEKCSLSYLVMGWYGVPKDDSQGNAPEKSSEDDPLEKAHGKGEVREFLESMKWFLPEDLDPEDLDQMICSGMVQDVVWDPDRRYIRDKEELGMDARIAVANTASEGLSALLPHIEKTGESASETDRTERLIDALQMERLDRLKEVDAVARLEDVVHKNTFSAESAGILWGIAPKGPEKDGPEIKQVRQKFAEDLSRLNALQAEYNQWVNNLQSQRQQLFFDWWKYMKARHPDREDRNATLKYLGSHDIGPTDVRKYILTRIKETDSGREDALSETINKACMEIEASLGDQYTLKPTIAPRYYTPNEPVLVLAGKELNPSTQHYGQSRTVDKQALSEIVDDAEGLWTVLIKNRYVDETGHVLSKLSELQDASDLNVGIDVDNDQKNKIYDFLDKAQKGGLKCRRESQLISSLTMRSGENTIEIVAEALPKHAKNRFVPPVADKLLVELFFLDPSHASALMSKTPAGERDSLLNAIKKEQEDYVKFHKAHLSGTLPSKIALNTWKKPWYPTFMHWEITYWPFQMTKNKMEDGIEIQSFKPDFITTNFELSEDTIDFAQKNAEWAEHQQNYKGICILTPHAVKKLEDQVSILNNEKIDALIEPLKNINVLSQTLSGFNDALLMREQTMQFGAHDPLAKTQREKDFHEAVEDFVKECDDTSPAPYNNFNPIRTGYMKIERVSIVDTFGQYREIKPSRCYPSRNLKPVTTTERGDCFLPPRIVQPARLKFRWLSAGGDFETSENPASNPICGWILPNYLDHSLAIYNNTGESLGSISPLDSKTLVFRASPGGQHDGFEDVMADANVHLKKFVSAILKKDRKLFKAFVNTLNNGLDHVEPKNMAEDNYTALMIGRPIALARVVLRIELKGPPVLNQSLNSLIHDVKKANGSRDSSDFAGVDFPVRLGCTKENNEFDDWLIGYFMEIGNRTDYDHFFSFHADPGDSTVIRPDKTTILLNASNGPLTLPVLIDPRAKLHATSGIFPKKRITIPQDHYEDALNAMEITFLTSPLIIKPDDNSLEKGDEIRIPVPDEGDYKWTWIEKERDGWKTYKTKSTVETESIVQKTQTIREGWLKLSKT